MIYIILIIRKIKNAGFLLLLVLPCLVFGQQKDLSGLDAFIAKQVADYKIPGLAIGIIKDNKVIFNKGYGLTSTMGGLDVNSQTVFPISSCTKAFTAAAVGILVDENKLNWDDKVIKYLPDFKLSDPWITKELTIMDILSHRSGLKSFDGDLLWYGTPYTRKEIIEKIRYAPVRNNFRVDFGYQNIMYLVAGMVVEAVSGKTWDEFLKEKIFKPLSMSNTGTNRDWVKKGSNFALPHLQNKPIKPLNMANISPAGGIDASVDDMLKWMGMMLGKGKIGNTTIMDDGTVETITGLKTITSDSGDEGYGLGWYIKYKQGKKILQHGGGMPGYRSNVILFPESNSGIVILTNKLSGVSDQLINVITDYLDKPGNINWSEADKSMSGKGNVYKWDREREDVSKLNTVIPDFDKYIGEYEDKAYGKAVIRKENGKPFLELLPTKELFSGYMYTIEKDTCKIILNDVFVPAGEVIFERDNEKKIIGFKLNIDSEDFLFGDLDFRRL